MTESGYEYMAERGSELGVTAPWWHAVRRNKASGEFETLREPDGSRRKFKSQPAAVAAGRMATHGAWS